MKKIFLITVLGFMILSQAAFSKTIEVKVNGMVCAFCAQGITKKFSARSEVKKADVNLKDKIVKLELNDKQDIQDIDIRAILQDSGYQVSEIKRQ